MREVIPDRLLVGTAYSQTLEAVGGDGTYEWALATGPLPPGLALSTAGVLSGTPTTAGEYTFTVQVASGGLTACPLRSSVAALRRRGDGLPSVDERYASRWGGPGSTRSPASRRPP